MKIRTRVAIIILLASLVPAEISILISYMVFKRAQEATFEDHLEYVASIKEERIQGTIEQMIEQVQLIAHRKFLIEFLASYQDTPLEDYRQTLMEILESAKTPSATFTELSIVLPSGNVVASTGNDLIDQPYEDIGFIGASMVSCTLMTSITHDNQFEITIGVPIEQDESVLGVLLVTIDPVRIISTIKDYTGLGKTGETLLAVHDGKGAYFFIAPSRTKGKGSILFFDKDDVQVILDREEFKKELLYDFVQYKLVESKQNTPVIMATRYIPIVNWGLVVKIDIEEVLQPVRTVRLLTLITTILMSMIIIVLAIIFSHSITRPILKLHTVSKKIDAGDLSQRVAIETQDEIGDLARSFNAMVDTLEIKKSELERINRRTQSENQELAALNKELDNLIHLIGHDLRNPLTTISGFVEIFSMKYTGNIDEEGNMYIDKIKKSSDRLNRLIEDLVMLSRVSRQVNTIELVNIGDIVNSIRDDMEIKIKNNNVHFVVRGNLPEIYADRVKLKIVFSNLIANAIKFSSKDNLAQPKVELGYIKEQNSHTFFVKDNGIGIDPQFHDKIFEMFKRLHLPDEYEGTGAGLSFVKRIVDDWHGHIWIDSSVGKGAVFYFSLPLASPSE
ncbi:MAG: ATP-binding protein [Candidatus Auribacterota bacterium]|nr:ATP-binding protein [Candidatus Auribacterota bacterium]